MMIWLTDERLFYGGIAVAAGSLLAAIFCFFLSQIRKIRLESRLNMEYGEAEKNVTGKRERKHEKKHEKKRK